MSAKIKPYLIGLGILAVSVILLLVFVLVKDNSSPPKTLNFVVNDITLDVGESKNNFYSSNLPVEIQYQVDKEGIVEVNIEENKIMGVKTGEVIVTLTVTRDALVKDYTFKVTVQQENYTINIVSVFNCSYQNETIILTDTQIPDCQFNIELKSPSNQLIAKSDFSITATGGQLRSTPLCYQFVLEGDSGKITISYFDFVKEIVIQKI